MNNARNKSAILLAASYLSTMAQEQELKVKLVDEPLKQEPDKFVLTNPYNELSPINYELPIKTKNRKGGNNRKRHKRKKAKNGRK